jgi:exopolyphosphatase/guanosine-5'-triphosphate,3'-diphosphate pyrophosphatase
MAAALHEVGRSIAHASYHKHSAYILQHADMPGFSKREQVWLSRLVLAHAGGLSKLLGQDIKPAEWDAILCLRLAVLFYRARLDEAPPVGLLSHHTDGYCLELDATWLEAHPLTLYALNEEVNAWQNMGVNLQIRPVASV